MSALWQGGVVALLLAWSLWVMAGRLFPATTAALRQRLARRLAARGHERLARRLATAPAVSGCDSGCSRCATGCGGAPQAQAVQWRPSSAGS